MAIIDAALKWTIQYTTERKAFGGTVADFQNTQFRLAGARECRRCAQLRGSLLELHERGELYAIDAAIAKLQATELLGTAQDECLQLSGGWGYTWEMPIARAYADARMARLAAGTSEEIRHVIAQSILPRK